MLLAVDPATDLVTGNARYQSLGLVPADGMNAAPGPARDFSDTQILWHIASTHLASYQSESLTP
jgi:hypothetical protein